MRNFRASAASIFAAAICVATCVAGTFLAAAPARAEDCAGNPGALGTSRVIVLESGELSRVGLMQYPDSLPLADKEVVLTFDDGPLPPHTNQILDILASQCLKATFLLVGRMAREYPATVRRIYEAGHTIGTHSENHPSRFRSLSVERVRQEIDQGIADVGAALGDPKELAPFFRIPGLARSDTIEQELAERSLVVFSSDVVADDWYRHIRPAAIISRAMSRLEKRGKGILLLHDIHPATVAALPGLLRQLKEQGFRIVHVIPGEQPGRIETAELPTPSTAEPPLPWTVELAAPNWPEVVMSAPLSSAVLPLPDISQFNVASFDEQTAILADGAEAAGLVTDADAPWADVPNATTPVAEVAELSAPGMQDLGIPFAGLQVVSEPLGLRSSLAATGAESTEPSRN